MHPVACFALLKEAPFQAYTNTTVTHPPTDFCQFSRSRRDWAGMMDSDLQLVLS